MIAALRLPGPLLARVGRSRREPIRGARIDPQVAAMLAYDDVLHESDLRGLAPGPARRSVETSAIAVTLPRRHDVTTRELVLDGPACALPCRAYEPRGIRAGSAAIVYFHGGGWVTGSIESHDALCRHLADEARVRVLSVAYRRAPESRFPAAADDALAAFRAVALRARDLEVDPARLAVMGDSAGGNLSAVVSQRTRQDAIRPALQVLLYPATDATRGLASHAIYAERWFLTRAMVDWYYDHYAPLGVDRRDPDLSPLFVEDARGLPRTHVYTAGFDPLVDEGEAYAVRLAEAGVATRYRCFETLPHGFAVMGGAIRAARRAVDEIAADIASVFET